MRPKLPGTLREVIDDATHELDASALGEARTWRLRQLAKDPATTPVTFERVAVRLGMSSPESITAHELRQLAIIDELPASQRPAGFPAGSDYSWRSLADGEWLPADDGDAEAMFDALRRWTLTESTAGRAAVRESLAAGILERSVLERLTGKRIAAQAGVSDEQLLRSWLRLAADAGNTGLDRAHEDLLQVRKVLRRMDESDPQLAELRSEALSLVKRNLRRLDGELSDGYSNHPEYAELGRLQAQADLFVTMRTLRRVADAPREAKAAAAAAAEGSLAAAIAPVTATATPPTPTAAPEGAAAGSELLSW
jgi:hypothetical protein